MLTSLDLIIAGFHEPVFAPQDKETNTAAMIATIASGNVHIISHPGNPKFPIDIQAVAQAAAKHRVALEINNSSFVHSRKGSEATAAKWLPPCVMPVVWWRWVLIHILHLRWAILASV
jgi:putative hydrolase